MTGGVWRPGMPVTDAGPRPPLPVLPLFPGVPGYAELDRRMRGLNFRHAADVLRPALSDGLPDAGFRVLDGLFLPLRGSRWRTADADLCRTARGWWRQQSGDGRAEGAAALARDLEDVTRRGPAALTRLVLYQVCCRLKDGGQSGGGSATAVALGVEEKEADELAAAVAAGFPAAGPARRNAEHLTDAWEAGGLRHAARLAARLPGGGDTVLAGLVERITGTEHHLAEARRLRAQGDPEAAARAALRAARLGPPGEPEIRSELARAAARLADAAYPGTSGGLTAEADRDGVRVSWPRPPDRGNDGDGTGTGDGSGTPPGRQIPPVRYQVLRYAEGLWGGEQATEIPPAGDRYSVYDAGPPPAQRVRYVVIPWRGQRIAGIARATAPVLFAPEAARVTGRAVPGGVRLSWQARPDVTRVSAVRLTDGGDGSGEGDGGAVPLDTERDGLTDRPLPAGEHRYSLSWGYRNGEGTLAWSAERQLTVEAVEWPAVVPGLAAERDGNDRVVLRWPAVARGETRLVRWTGSPLPPGEDVSGVLGPGPASGAAPGPAAVEDGAGLRAAVRPRPGEALRLMAVSVLDGRAVSGPTALVETPGAVRGLTVRRLGPKRAEVRFGWPQPAVLVQLSWVRPDRRPGRLRLLLDSLPGLRGRRGRRGAQRHEQGGGQSNKAGTGTRDRTGAGHRVEKRYLARSQYGGGRVEIPVTRHACEIRMLPVARPDAAVVIAEESGVHLPAFSAGDALRRLARPGRVRRRTPRRRGLPGGLLPRLRRRV